MSERAPRDIVMEEFLQEHEAFATQVAVAEEQMALPAEVIDAATWLSRPPPPVDPVLDETFDAGDKVCVIGASKTRKSFFALQLGACLAGGTDFLAWKVGRPRRVLVVQMEIQERHYWRRVRRMGKALGLNEGQIGNRLGLVNARGKGISVEHLGQYAEQFQAEVLIVDPLYKLTRGDENSAEHMSELLGWFDELAQSTGAAVVYVHHDAKGAPGDRETRDRGSGSGVLGRDYDACITLTEHRDEDDAVVIQTLLRNYAPQQGFVVAWEDNCFRVADDLEAVQATSRSRSERKQRGPGLQEMAEIVRTEILGKPWRVDALKAEIQRRFSVGRIKSEDVCRLVTAADGVEVAKTATFPQRVLVGPMNVTEREALRITEEWRDRKLKI